MKAMDVARKNKAPRRKKIREIDGARVRARLRKMEFAPGDEICGFTTGETSVVDMIDGILQHIGRSSLIVSTWTAARSDIKHCVALIGSSRIAGMRWIVDRSFVNRQPELSRLLEQSFPGCISTARVHAKFVLFENDGWRVSLWTSANLNRNARVENFILSTDPSTYEMMREMVEVVIGDSVDPVRVDSDDDRFSIDIPDISIPDIKL